MSKLLIHVTLEIDVEDWQLAYGLEADEVRADAINSILAYRDADAVFAGADDAPFKVHSVQREAKK